MNKIVDGRREDLTRMLPIDARLKDMALIFVDPRFEPDPCYLLDSRGDILHEWPYAPTLGEIDDVLGQLKCQ